MLRSTSKTKERNAKQDWRRSKRAQTTEYGGWGSRASLAWAVCRLCRDRGRCGLRYECRWIGPGGPVGTLAASLRATVCVGETWNETDCVATPPARPEVVAVSPRRSFALPPSAVGALCELDLLPMYTPRPIPPATHCKQYISPV